MPFDEAPDLPEHWYAAWVDEPGADELTAVAPEPVAAGVVWAGECVTQSTRRHLMHNDIGSFSLMKNLAALFRESWHLRAARRGEHLLEPGRGQLLDWMGRHLTVSAVRRDPSVDFKEVLAELVPPLRLEGWRPERTPLRVRISDQRARFDAEA